jgi:hypothetical protein
MKRKTEHSYALMQIQPDLVSLDNIYVYWVVKRIYSPNSMYCNTYIAKKNIKAEDRETAFNHLLELKDDEYKWTDLAECIF